MIDWLVWAAFAFHHVLFHTSWREHECPATTGVEVAAQLRHLVHGGYGGWCTTTGCRFSQP
jgi:hypothetical protein